MTEHHPGLVVVPDDGEGPVPDLLDTAVQVLVDALAAATERLRLLRAQRDRANDQIRVLVAQTEALQRMLNARQPRGQRGG